MSASEFAFLVLGLVLGIALGAGFLAVLRSRSTTPHEVRVTVAPATVPSRSATLAGDPFDRAATGPAPGGPGDRRAVDRPDETPILADPDEAPPTLRAALVPAFAGTGGLALQVPLGPATRTAVLEAPLVHELRPARIVTASTMTATVGVAPAEVATIEILAAPAADPPVASRVADASTADQGLGTVARAEGPCAELRAVAEDRCAVAGRARDAAAVAATALRDAQRAYDDEIHHADEADATADPRAIRTAKEDAQQAFRAARERAATRDELEAAARTWLASINRINLDARDASARASRARAAANALVTTVERLTAEADAARVAKDVAEEACTMARQAVADCDEAASVSAAAAIAAAAPPAPPIPVEPAARFPDDEPELRRIEPGDRDARIMRLVRGDRDALMRTVAELGGDDAGERRRWQIALTGLVDAIVAQAIDASILDVPDEPAFWAAFTAAQRREIVSALSSLGYRFDGLTGFADGRVPSQRDLSLALGYAGLDPMRIRRWPTEAESRALLAGARVAADEYLAAAAGGLTLSELVDLLGRRADALTDLWNEWGRVRSRLLAVD